MSEKKNWARRAIAWLTGPRKRDPLDDVEVLNNPTTAQAVSALAIADLVRERRSNRRWVQVRRAMWVVSMLLVAAYYIFYMVSFNGWKLDLSHGDYAAVVRIEGQIMANSVASAEKVVPALRAAFEDERAKFVILAINSPGGSPVEADRINFMIAHLKAKHGKPVYAVIDTVGASAAYMIAMHADRIYASKYSLVGSIGAVISAWDLHKALARIDITQKVYASGELKSMLSPFSAPSSAGDAKAQALADRAGGLFVREMMASRGDRLKADVRYDTGEVWDGEQALAIGLVDELATIEKLAEERRIHLREFGPGTRTISPLGARVSETTSSWISDVVMRSITKVSADVEHLQMEVR